MEEELKCRNTASNASGLSFARCWLRAEVYELKICDLLRNEKGNKFLSRDFFASFESGIGMDSIL